MKAINKIKDKSLIYSLIYLCLFIIFWFILNALNYEYLQWFKIFSVLLIIIGIIIGTVITIRNSKYEEKDKFLLYCVYLAIELIISFIVILIISFPLLYQTEKIVKKDGILYIEEKYSFLLSNHINYYKFSNIIFRTKKVTIYKSYNNSLSDDEYLKTTYYDDEGKVIKEETKEDVSIDNLETSPDDLEVLYTKKIDQNISFRILRVDYILNGRSLVYVEKSSDGGKTFVNNLETSDKFLTVNNEASYKFLNEFIGFINNNDSTSPNKGLIATRDGGKTFEDVIFKIDEVDYLYLDGMPYFEDNNLKLNGKLYLRNNPENITLISYDNGLSWEKY